MALAREALRISVVHALEGKTWARVFDSQAGAIEDVAPQQNQPFIAVYTDDGTFGDVNASGIVAGGGEQTLLIEIGVTSRVKIEGSDELEPVQPETDAARELIIGLIERQVQVALFDPTSMWAQIWPKFVMNFGEATSGRGTLFREGVRFAGRQIVMKLTLIRDPKPGTTIAEGSCWGQFLAALEADPDETTQAVADQFRAAIAGGATTWKDWEKLAAAFGLSVDQAQALGLAPPANVQPNEPTFVVPPAGHPDAETP